MPTLQLKVIIALYEPVFRSTNCIIQPLLLIEGPFAIAGPKQSTVGDFWRMVWQYKVNHIVMVTGVCEAGKVSFGFCKYIGWEWFQLESAIFQ